MKRLALVIAMVAMMASVCFADNSVRIAELEKDLQRVVQEIQSAEQYKQNKQVEGLKIEGALEELREMDKPKFEIEPKE